ncbi:nucleoside recognition domain protein [Desulfatibacillum aliphaticivorans]|uniref:Nucleoside recognition domain protein n=1 Tax=Desulfatibacillum aliphaticivorans TaxID=218208 RepID=B8FH66_DESAL|nr:nucleoside recognition protein [Desulfatibacillum aliphaticivorans]ACL02154.1 nucleoside recognition domain protein [Desulfatibacillum aliphaticivorans]
MSRRKKNNNPRALAIGLLITIAALGVGLMAVDGLEAAKLPSKLLLPLARLLLFVSIGLVAAQAIDSTNWTEKLGFLAAPMFRFANLGAHCSAAFTAAFFSGVSANAMLLDFYKEERITKRQLFLTNFINQFPAYFLHLPVTFFIVVPLTKTAGLLYFLLTFLATCLRTALFASYGHIFMKPKNSGEQNFEGQAKKPASRKKKKPFWEGLKAKVPSRFVRVVAFVVPTYTVVYVLTAAGAFDALETFMTRFAVQAFIPVESLSVVVLSFASEFTAGFAAAGALMDAGSITVKQTVIALLLGNIIAFPIRAIRHQLPRYMGIFSPGMGLQMLLMGQGFRVASIILAGAVYWFVG